MHRGQLWIFTFGVLSTCAGFKWYESTSFARRLHEPLEYIRWSHSLSSDQLTDHVTRVVKNTAFVVIGDSTSRNILKHIVRSSCGTLAADDKSWQKGRHNLILQRCVGFKPAMFVFQYFPLVLHDTKPLKPVTCGKRTLPRHSVSHVLEYLHRYFFRNSTNPPLSEIIVVFGGIALHPQDPISALNWLNTGGNCGPLDETDYKFIFRTNGPRKGNSTMRQLTNQDIVRNVRSAAMSSKRAQFILFDASEELDLLYPEGVKKDPCMCHWNDSIDQSLATGLIAHL